MKIDFQRIHIPQKYTAFMQPFLMVSFTRGGIFICMAIASNILPQNEFGKLGGLYWISTAIGQIIGYMLITSNISAHSLLGNLQGFNKYHLRKIFDLYFKISFLILLICLIIFISDFFLKFTPEFYRNHGILIAIWSIAIALEVASINLASSLNVMRIMIAASLLQLGALSVSPISYLISHDYWLWAVVSSSCVSSIIFFITAVIKSRYSNKIPDKILNINKMGKFPDYTFANLATVVLHSSFAIVIIQAMISAPDGISSIAEYTAALQVVSALSLIPQILNLMMNREIYQSDISTYNLGPLKKSVILSLCFTAMISVIVLPAYEIIFDLYRVDPKNPLFVIFISLFILLSQSYSLSISHFLVVCQKNNAVLFATLTSFTVAVGFFFVFDGRSAIDMLLSLFLFHFVRAAIMGIPLFASWVKSRSASSV